MAAKPKAPAKPHLQLHVRVEPHFLDKVKAWAEARGSASHPAALREMAEVGFNVSIAMGGAPAKKTA